MMYENKYRGQQRPPKPRDVITDPGYEMEPIVEIAIKQRSLISQFSQFGDAVDNNIVSFDEHGQHFNVPVSKFALIVNLQCGIPHDHPDFPVVKKLDTRFKSNNYYMQFPKPVVWLKHDDYRHIPGFTRFVMNKDGKVRNAYCGTEIVPSSWGMYKLVRDQASNKTINVDLNTLRMLAFTKLPDDFIDFGFGARSHELEFNKGKIEWVHRKSVVVKNMKDGSVGTYPSALHFAKMNVKDFDAARKISFLKHSDLFNQLVTVNEYQIRYEDFDPSTPIPVENFTMPVAVPAPSLLTEPAQTEAPAAPVQQVVDITDAQTSAADVFDEF